jgi:nitrite reductase/ring-hydroxylating ferredoxin subunit/uncharacterized membrane protein
MELLTRFTRRPVGQMAVMAMTQIVDRTAGASALDPVASRLTALTGKVPVAVRDALHGVWLGHPLHPMLAQVPVGSWLGAAVLDTLAVMTPEGERRAGVERSAAALLATGLAAVPVTAAAGSADWSKLHPEQQRVGLVHAAANVVAASLLTASLVQRRRGRQGAGRLLGLLGVGVASAGAGIGGHLAYRWAAGANHAEHVPHVTPEDWAELGPLGEFDQRTPHRRLVGETPVVVVRRGSTLNVLAATCSHLSGPLDEGTVVEDDGVDCLVCPWHGSSFVLDDGSVRHGPATAPQPEFDVQVVEGVVRARVRPPA